MQSRSFENEIGLDYNIIRIIIVTMFIQGTNKP